MGWIGTGGPRLRTALAGIPLPLRITSALVATAFVTLLGVKSYQAYEATQHDNEFCVSCHVMEAPFRRFEQSGHHELTCSACHHPTLIERTRMALTAFIENPTEISTHADVPDDTCAECHIQGDPEQWHVISATPGHRVHLESDRPELGQLRCVRCHSVGLHEFAPLARTCAQAGCHVDVEINLGAMGAETDLHCTGCHNFLVNTTPTFLGEAGELTPGLGECPVCHASEISSPQFDFAQDVHAGECAKCHNPHTQTDAPMAAQSCTESGCHDDALSLTPFHRGLGTTVASDCVRCHQAHHWTIGSSSCPECHTQAEEAVPASWRGFSHARHASVECTLCHDSQQAHGTSLIQSQADCTECHHQPSANVQSCSGCHVPSHLTQVIERTLSLEISAAAAPKRRSLSFDHIQHASLGCESCHRHDEGFNRDVDCASCHASHHERERSCSVCHGTQVLGAHEASAHLGCSASGCHSQSRITTFLGEHDGCLACHVDRTDHEVGSDCRDCHEFP